MKTNHIRFAALAAFSVLPTVAFSGTGLLLDPVNHDATAVTGQVMIWEDRIQFQNGAVIALAPLDGEAMASFPEFEGKQVLKVLAKGKSPEVNDKGALICGDMPAFFSFQRDLAAGTVDVRAYRGDYSIPGNLCDIFEYSATR